MADKGWFAVCAKHCVQVRNCLLLLDRADLKAVEFSARPDSNFGRALSPQQPLMAALRESC